MECDKGRCGGREFIRVEQMEEERGRDNGCATVTEEVRKRYGRERGTGRGMENGRGEKGS